MSLIIESDETCLPASELSQLTGETVTGAITVALRKHLEREQRRRDIATRAKELRAITDAAPSAWDRGSLLSSTETCSAKNGPALMIIARSALLSGLNWNLNVECNEVAILATAPCRMSMANALGSPIEVERRGGLGLPHHHFACKATRLSPDRGRVRGVGQLVRTNLGRQGRAWWLQRSCDRMWKQRKGLRPEIMGQALPAAEQGPMVIFSRLSPHGRASSGGFDGSK